jgi:hypothetical protein
MGTCNVCPPGDNSVPDVEALDHLRVFHPDVYGDGPEVWPDGLVVVYDMTLEPIDFEEHN